MIRDMLLAIVAVVLIAAGCGERPVCQFKEGEFVRMKLTGHRAQIIDVSMACSYYVRIAAEQKTTDTHVLGSGGPISASPVALIKVWEFELSKDIQQ